MSDIKVQMEGIVTPTYDKRRKGYKFKADDMEIFIKSADTAAGKKSAMDQMSRLLKEQQEKEEEKQKQKQKEKEETEKTTFAFSEGGLKDEGGTIDPVSGNDVPTGSTKKEVRDDIPAQLSEGEFVFPADVVRYIGLENLMELRQKAKAGLKKMEAMGQMGNSEEATMDDEGEYNDEIDQLIDNFDPNDPETMKFAQGGIVYASNGAYMPQQQFSTGYMPTTGYTAPSVPAGQQPSFITNPANVAVGAQTSAPELRRYVGPNGEILMVPFYNGKPMQGYTIPANYKYQPEEEAVKQAPEIVQPAVQQEDDDAGREERREAEAGRVAQEKELNNLLAKYDPKFAEVIAKDPFMTGELANPYTALMATFNTVGARTDSIPEVLGSFGIPAENFETKGLGSGIPGNKYDIGKLANTLRTADVLVEQLGLDPADKKKLGRIIEYTDLDSDGDGRVTKDDLIDKSGKFTKAGRDLFMDLDDGTDPADTPAKEPGDLPEYKGARPTLSRQSDDDGPSGDGRSDSGGGIDQGSDEDVSGPE